MRSEKPSLGWIRSVNTLGASGEEGSALNKIWGTGLKNTATALAGWLGQALASTHIERHPGPTPVINKALESDIGLGRRVVPHPFLTAVAWHLLTMDIAGTILGPHHALLHVLPA